MMSVAAKKKKSLLVEDVAWAANHNHPRSSPTPLSNHTVAPCIPHLPRHQGFTVLFDLEDDIAARAVYFQFIVTWVTTYHERVTRVVTRRLKTTGGMMRRGLGCGGGVARW